GVRASAVPGSRPRRRRRHHAVGRSVDRHRTQSRSHRALRVGALLPQSQAAAAIAPDHRAHALAVGRRRSIRQRELLRRGVSARHSGRPARNDRPGRTLSPSRAARGARRAHSGVSRDGGRRRAPGAGGAMSMRAWFFSENAYHLLPDAREYDSIRVQLPNRFYDPKIGADLYHRFIDEWKTAEDLGLRIMVNEHHQTATNLTRGGPIVMGILARETRSARLLILGNPIANRREPVRVAEE